jgi:hypothetical protein
MNPREDQPPLDDPIDTESQLCDDEGQKEMDEFWDTLSAEDRGGYEHDIIKSGE